MDSLEDTPSPDALESKLFTASSGVVLAIASLVVYLLHEAYATNFPKVQSIPEAPGALPFIGHLLPLGGRQNHNDATIYSRSADQVSSQIFRCRIGNQRSIMVGSWKIAKDL